MSKDVIRSYFKDQIRYMQSWDTTSINLDGEGSTGYTYSMPGYKLYVMEPDKNTVDRASKVINGMTRGISIKKFDVE